MRAYVTVLDNDVTLLPYFVRHYRRLGADLFPCLGYGSDLNAVCEIVLEAGGEPLELASFPSDVFSARRREAFIRTVHPEGEWAFFADLDEFAEVTFDQVQQFVGRVPYVAGQWLDRCGLAGKLVEINSLLSLDDQFPCSARTRQEWRMTASVYVLAPFAPCLHHPSSCPIGRKHLRQVPRVTVHHFRWQTNLVRRLRRRLERIEALGKHGGPWYRGVERTLRHINDNGGIAENLVSTYRGRQLEVVAASNSSLSTMQRQSSSLPALHSRKT